MKPKTYLSIILTCEGRKESAVDGRGALGLFGIGVGKDALALEYQRLDRISKMAQRGLVAVSAAQEQRMAEFENAIARQDWVFDSLQACERSLDGLRDDYDRATEMARTWKAAAKRSWGKLHYGKDKVPSAEERAAMPPLCDYCHTRHFGYQEHDLA